MLSERGSKSIKSYSDVAAENLCDGMDAFENFVISVGFSCVKDDFYDYIKKNHLTITEDNFIDVFAVYTQYAGVEEFIETISAAMATVQNALFMKGLDNLVAAVEIDSSIAELLHRKIGGTQ